jgi:histone-arginine methyltransferase CARM1
MLLAPSISHKIDFMSISIEECLFLLLTNDPVKAFTIPIEWISGFTGVIHGIAGWFDLDLAGSTLDTSPSSARTHWQQVRFLFEEPLAIDVITGEMKLVVNDSRSYDVDARVSCGGSVRTGAWGLQDQTYHYETGADLSRPEFNGMYLPASTTE